MRNELYIGLDCSTTAAKAIAWTLTGEQVAEGRSPLAVSTPNPGMAEQDAEAWWQASATALRRCNDQLDGARIGAVGITVQRETFVLLDAAFKSIRPAILWYDARAVTLMAELAAEVSADEYHQRTGKQLDTTSAIGKLAWLRRHEQEHLAATVHLGDVLAFLSHRLTGELRTTPAGADTMGLIDLHARHWDTQLLRIAGLELRQMPELVAAGDLLGHLTEQAAKATGLPPGLPIVAGGGDGHCFAYAATRSQQDAMTLSLGTSGVLGFRSTTPHLGEAFRTLIGCEAKTFILEAVMQCGSDTLRWLHETLLGASDAGNIGALEAACANLPAGSEGLLVLPYWRGVRVPEPDPLARGVVLGWSDAHGPAHLQRAIMEGIAMEAARLARHVASTCGLEQQHLVVGGGGAASDTWCQILADAFACLVVRPHSRELASLAAARLAMPPALREGAAQLDLSADHFLPDPRRMAIYTQLGRLQAQAYAQNREILHALWHLVSR